MLMFCHGVHADKLADEVADGQLSKIVLIAILFHNNAVDIKLLPMTEEVCPNSLFNTAMQHE